MYIGAISVIICIFLANYFKRLGVEGLALALTIGNIFNAVLLYITYKYIYHKSLDELQLLKTTLISFVSSLIMATGIWYTLQLVDALYHLNQIPTSTREVLGLFIQTTVALSVGLAIYWFLARVWQKDELTILHNKK